MDLTNRALRSADTRRERQIKNQSEQSASVQRERIPKPARYLVRFFPDRRCPGQRNLGLTVLQTLFMREHNFWADIFKNADPTLDDDGVYFRARAMVGAEIEVITYRDFIPLLLGANALAPYTGYNPDVDSGIANEFSTAAFRVGHTLLSPQLLRLDANGQSIGDLTLHESHFSPKTIRGLGSSPICGDWRSRRHSRSMRLLSMRCEISFLVPGQTAST